MKKICFIAQFPPPIHGLSKAVETLYNSNLKDRYQLTGIDITSNKLFLLNIFKIIFNRSDLFYFTIAQSKQGNLRDLVILFLLFLKRKKVIVHLHGGFYRQLVDKICSSWQRKLNYKLMGRVSGAIVLGKSLEYIFKDIVDDSRVYTVPNCVDDRFLTDDRVFNKKVNDIGEKGILTVLYLSNFIKTKGYFEVLELAAKANIERHNMFKFEFAGAFPGEKEKNEFMGYINDSKLEEMVKYRGIVSGKDKNELLDGSDIFILPTRYPNEGQPISIIEAMGSGMAIITTSHAGIPDLIKSGENGFIVEYDDVNDMLQKISYLYDNRITLQKIMRNNRLEVLNNYREAEYIRNIEKIFDEVISK
jgi:glycosyltransferase involved in cell wall biosynthesis